MIRVLIVMTALLATPLPLMAGTLVDEHPQEERIRQIATQLRCPVCQSENILDSHSGTAREMLDLVREQAAEGQTDAQILAFFQTRYGDYVLLSPPARGAGLLIWGIPLLLVIAGAVLGLVFVRRLRERERPDTTDRLPLSVARLEEFEP